MRPIDKLLGFGPERLINYPHVMTLLHATRGVPPSMDGGAYSMDGDPSMDLCAYASILLLVSWRIGLVGLLTTLNCEVYINFGDSSMKFQVW